MHFLNHREIFFDILETAVFTYKQMTPRASLLGAEATTQGGRVNLATNKQFIKSVSNGLFLLSPAAPQPTPATTALPPSH